MLKVLFIGDIVGRPGRDIVVDRLAQLRKEWSLDFVIANAENAAHGAGLTGTIARELLAAGVDAITLGDHVWDQKGFETEISTFSKVCRPANLHPACPGKSHIILESRGFRMAVFTVLGRQFMNIKSDCPFATSDRLLTQLSEKEGIHSVLVEIHAEATSEKIALSWHLDGRAAAVLGTHTHVPTADARILPGGTAALTDVGMTGPYASVLGREVAPVIGRFIDGMPRRFGVADNDVRLSGALVEIDIATSRALKCELVTIRKEA